MSSLDHVLETGAYEIETGAEGLNVDLHPDLVAAAKAMPVMPSYYTTVVGMPPDQRETTVDCHRCLGCFGIIVPDDLTGRVGHLTAEHGWRMDGKRYDGGNRVITDE